ncbi:hypothetical protein Bca4012_031273 [Brassica carinata]|uniref:Uncharacterized protein n=1 Tax=Brassica carinata TaxID=52824 RepID=A0A8X7RJA9_BRACI|nr:hypothetical protein Bca52824_047494 [Brassica carinata]
MNNTRNNYSDVPNQSDRYDSDTKSSSDASFSVSAKNRANVLILILQKQELKKRKLKKNSEGYSGEEDQKRCRGRQDMTMTVNNIDSPGVSSDLAGDMTLNNLFILEFRPNLGCSGNEETFLFGYPRRL